MAATRPKRSASRSSATAVSTPKKNPTKSSPRSSATSKGKTSPYFAKSKPLTVAKAKTNGRGQAKSSSRQVAKDARRSTMRRAKDDDDGDEADGDQAKGSYLKDATGLTESSVDSSDDEASEDEFAPTDEENGEGDSDNLDDAAEDDEDEDEDFDDDEDSSAGRRKPKRKSTGGGGGGKKVRTSGGGASGSWSGHDKGAAKNGGCSDEEELDDEVELEEGQQLAGRIYPAPKTGQVPPGQISRNTFKFLANLQIPERNDRDWFRSHEPAFRQAEKEWQAFASKVQLKLHEADDEVPILPPKDVIHRIYRDVRFSSDKTPYKKSFSLTTSRGGRKGIWACYHLSISPNSNSILACGIWQPGKNETATMRHHILHDPSRFRATISGPEFVRLFGKPEPRKGGGRQNVFGHDDMLKVAPKGVEKGHKDIDLLKLRSVAVVHRFEDDEVLAPDFQDKVRDVARVMVPFVHMLNDFVSLPPPAIGGGDGGGDDEDEDD